LRLPRPRGPLSNVLFCALRDESPLPSHFATPDAADLHISLWALYELHYGGFDEVADDLEWDPGILAGRQQLEQRFETSLRRLTSELVDAARAEAGLVQQLERIVSQTGPSVANYLQRYACRDQFEEFMVDRSLYQLKESDPQSWALPRLRGAPKVALAELQYDEYGAGDPTMLHQQLYADGMESLGLDSGYGAYVNRVPAHTLMINNAMTLFGLHRRLRGACVGHLTAFEMTSSVPCRRFAQGAERLALPAPVVRYFDEHVEADAVHEQLALRSLCVPLIEDEPTLQDDVLFGAATCVVLDARAAEATLTRWSSVSPPPPPLSNAGVDRSLAPAILTTG
jgi:hypothetical protein